MEMIRFDEDNDLKKMKSLNIGEHNEGNIRGFADSQAKMMKEYNERQKRG